VRRRASMGRGLSAPSDHGRIVTGTSEIAIVTSRAGCARAARRPPLMRERCLRTVLISVIDAPQASSDLVSACFSTSDRSAVGAIQLAERRLR